MAGRARPMALAALAAAVGALAGGCGGEEDGGGDAGAAPSGKTVFVDAGCGDCHTLSAAGTTGTTGSNLDAARLAAPQVEEVVRNGATGMPPYEGRLSEAEISAVSEYVARSRP